MDSLDYELRKSGLDGWMLTYPSIEDNNRIIQERFTQWEEVCNRIDSLLEAKWAQQKE